MSKFAPPSRNVAPKPHQTLDDGGIQVMFGRHPSMILYPPSTWKASSADTKAPDGSLHMHHVYGINGSAGGCVAHVVQGNCCIYPIARVCVVEDLDGPNQKFFTGHNADVLCLSYCDKCDLAISGQQDPPGSGGAFACIWSPSFPSRAVAELRYYVDKADRDTVITGEGLVATKAFNRPRANIREHVQMIPMVAGQDLRETEYPQREITAVGIACHGRAAVTFCKDDQCSACVYQLPDRLFDGRGPPQETLCFRKPTHTIGTGRVYTDAIFVNPHDSRDIFRFCAVGKGFFKLWEYQIASKTLEGTAGTFTKTPPCTPTFAAYTADEAVLWLSGDNGYIYIVTGSTCTSCALFVEGGNALGAVAVVPSSSGRVDTLAVGVDGSLILGKVGPDPTPPPGKKKQPGVRHQIVDKFMLTDLRNADLLPSGMAFRWSSAAVGADGRAVLVARSNMCVVVDLGVGRYSSKRVDRVMQIGHQGEAWALEHHPSSEGLAVSGDTSGMIRFWDTADCKPLAEKSLKCDLPVWCLAFDQSGELLAAGLSEGMMMVFEFPSLEILCRKRVSQIKDPKGHYERLSDIKFSGIVDGKPQGQGTLYIATSAWDQNIYLLKVMYRKGTNKMGEAKYWREVKTHGKLSGNSSSPTHVHFTANSEYVMSCSKDGQLLVWKTSNGQRVPNVGVKDVPWMIPWTCVLGWPVIGIWKPNFDLSDINCVCQSCPDGPCGSKVMAVGDDEQNVRLYRFPAPNVAAKPLTYEGHAAHVTNVRFSQTNVLLSLGGGDHAMIQWSLSDEKAREALPSRKAHPWSGLEHNDPIINIIGREDAEALPPPASRRPPRPRQGGGVTPELDEPPLPPPEPYEGFRGAFEGDVLKPIKSGAPVGLRGGGPRPPTPDKRAATPQESYRDELRRQVEEKRKLEQQERNREEWWERASSARGCDVAVVGYEDWKGHGARERHPSAPCARSSSSVASEPRSVPRSSSVQRSNRSSQARQNLTPAAARCRRIAQGRR